MLIAAWALLLTGIPLPAKQFDAQLVDHFSTSGATYSQRYYEIDQHFGGPGNPIICIVGGEGAVPPSVGVFYPWVGVNLAQRFKALVIQPEHRFYGTSIPAGGASPFDAASLALLTPQQALADTAALIVASQRAHNCTEYGTPGYCPVITVGGSYPGFLSAMMRLRYPAVVDMAYAASAPALIYAQQTDHAAYYEVVTRSAERAVTGCPAAVRAAFADYLSIDSKDGAIAALGLCNDASAMPPYLAAGDLDALRLAVNMVLMYSFADLNMQNYPPASDTGLAKACGALVARPTAQGLKAFLVGYAGLAAASSGARAQAAPSCFNLSTQLPAGHLPTISAGDWSGVGTGANGLAWDYQTCSLLIERISTNGETDMFPPRESTLEWLGAHCSSRFGVTPQPRALADEWGFDRMADLTSRIIFTNGLNDGWSAGSVVANLSESLIAINMPNGAHHSDLSHDAPGPQDTDDVIAGRAQAAALLEGWLHDIRKLPED